MSGSGTGAISSWLAAAYEEEREGGGRDKRERVRAKLAVYDQQK